MLIAGDELGNTLPPGNLAVRSSFGGWKSARLIIFVEMAEQFASYGISSNLITYLTGPLGESAAAAAANINAWCGTEAFLPLLWSFVADSFLGRFRTIIISSSLYILGLGLLSFSAMIPSHSKDSNQLQVTLFFISLYLIALGQGGFSPCIKVFGADQFDGNDLKELKAKSSFFNWLMFGSCVSILTTRLISSYIQENLSWSLGFGIPGASMLLALLLFLLGTKTYRFTTERRGNKNPFARIICVFIEAVKNRRQPDLHIANPNETLLLVAHQSSKQFRFLDRAAVSCDLSEIEDAKAVLKLVPIWINCLVYSTVCSQIPTFFTKQGSTMNRYISPGILVPAATLQCVLSLAMVFFIPIYDRLLVPIARSFTQNPLGITTLQRIGAGMFLSNIAMVVAALVETKRLQTAQDDITTMMSVWWLVPQYAIYGVSYAFLTIGLQEFFYDQVPSELRSVGMALNLSIFGVGNFLSSFMISVIDKVTSQLCQTSWFDNDLNNARLDYFYWLLACVSSMGLASYLWFAKSETGTTLSYGVVEGSVDFRGKPSLRFSSGGWRSSGFIIGAEVSEKFAYFGVASNLITYFTAQLGESTAAAASNVNLWLGTAAFLPLIWGSIADSFLGRFRTILFTSSLYILGLGLLTFSATIPSACKDQETLVSCVSQFKVTIFFCALYLIALGEGGFKACLRAFGADQFDEQDPIESKAKSSFFNWLYFAISFGILATRLVSNYVQENLSWALGFGIPCVSMMISLFFFLLGTNTYRFSTGGEVRQGRKHNNPFVRIGRVFVAAAKNRRETSSETLLFPHESSKQYRFLDRAAISCDSAEVEEAKSVLSLVPVWMCCLVFGIVYAQSPTFFTKQGATMDRSISSTFSVPAATLQGFISVSILVFIPIYDRVLVPIARSITHKPAGITTLQRITTGIFLSILSMVIAALVEMKRLKTARDHGLVDSPNATVPMSVCWLIPQYVLYGVSDVFTMVGLQEFFYGQIPVELRSLGLSMYLSVIGIGNYLSSFMVSVIEKTTSQPGQASWFDNNLNQAHLDYFYWLLACLSSISFVSLVYFAKSYVYNSPK
ncbi:unnamed protein product [Brassica oleracea]